MIDDEQKASFHHAPAAIFPAVPSIYYHFVSKALYWASLKNTEPRRRSNDNLFSLVRGISATIEARKMRKDDFRLIIHTIALSQPR